MVLRVRLLVVSGIFVSGSRWTLRSLHGLLSLLSSSRPSRETDVGDGGSRQDENEDTIRRYALEHTSLFIKVNNFFFFR